MIDFETLERAWRSGANTPSEAAQAYVTEGLEATLRRRRREARGLLVISGGLLTIWSGLILHAHFVRGLVDFAREWSVILIFLLSWGSLGFVVWQLRQHMTRHPDPYASTWATLQALLDENLGGQRRTFVMLALQLVLAAVLTLFFRQMLEVGKMEPAHVQQMAVLFAAIFAGIDGWLLWRLVRVLRPDARRLERLLADYAS